MNTIRNLSEALTVLPRHELCTIAPCVTPSRFSIYVSLLGSGEYNHRLEIMRTIIDWVEIYEWSRRFSIHSWQPASISAWSD